MCFHLFNPICPAARSGFTIMEVLVAVLLIAISMGSIVTVNTGSANALRTSREMAASSQILQQRLEQLRDQPWADIASASRLAALMQTPTSSEEELKDPQCSEAMKVTTLQDSLNGPVESSRFFTVHRAGGRVDIPQTDDLSTETALFFEGSIVWHGRGGIRQRTLRTVICRAGLTRSGLIGSVLGRPGAGRASQ